MAAVRTHWTESLRSTPLPRVTSLVSARELREAVLELGDEPTRWALQVSQEIAEKLGSQLTEIGQGSAAFTVLQSGIQSAVLAMLTAVRLGAVPSSRASEGSRDSARVCVELGVELGTVLAAVRRAHALTVERFMQGCRALAPKDKLPEHFASISEVCFAFVDQLADDLTRLHAEELQQWHDNPHAERLALVERLLAGEEVDPAMAAEILRYEIRFRHHIAVCVWHCDDNGKARDELEDTALQFLRTNEAAQTLIIQQPDSSILAWGNSRTPLTGPPPTPVYLDARVRLSVGSAGHDFEGFRSAAAQAREAQEIVKRLPGLADPVYSFEQVSLIGLLSRDVEKAQRFVRAELGRLADDDETNIRLLETLDVYLDSHSPQTVAQQLFVARNTVTYRLHKVEELLGRSISLRQPQLRAAILLARGLRG
jgi:DNA-binding PucR family transcriptional regulator